MIGHGSHTVEEAVQNPIITSKTLPSFARVHGPWTIHQHTLTLHTHQFSFTHSFPNHFNHYIYINIFVTFRINKEVIRTIATLFSNIITQLLLNRLHHTHTHIYFKLFIALHLSTITHNSNPYLQLQYIFKYFHQSNVSNTLIKCICIKYFIIKRKNYI